MQKRGRNKLISAGREEVTTGMKMWIDDMDTRTGREVLYSGTFQTETDMGALRRVRMEGEEAGEPADKEEVLARKRAVEAGSKPAAWREGPYHVARNARRLG